MLVDEKYKCGRKPISLLSTTYNLPLSVSTHKKNTEMYITHL